MSCVTGDGDDDMQKGACLYDMLLIQVGGESSYNGQNSADFDSDIPSTQTEYIFSSPFFDVPNGLFYSNMTTVIILVTIGGEICAGLLD